MGTCATELQNAVEVVVCVQPLAPLTNYLQPALTLLGIFVATVVAFWSGSRQHRAQVLHQVRQDVARFLVQADAFSATARRGLSQETSNGPKVADEIEEALAAVSSAFETVRLTAPNRIYQSAAAVYEILHQVVVSLQIKKLSFDEQLVVAQENLDDFPQQRRDLVRRTVDYSWMDQKKSRLAEAIRIRRGMAGMRRRGIEGDMDGSSPYDRSWP